MEIVKMKNYGKGYKKEMAFYICPVTGKVTYNKKCKKCIRECKQSYKTIVCACKNYIKKGVDNE